MMIKIPAYVTNAIGELPIDWSLEKIEELAYFQEGPGLRQWQYRDSGIPFLNIRCIKTNGTIDFTSVQYLDENEVQKKYSHFLLNENDTVISSSGTLGKIAVIKKSHLPLLLNTSIIRFVSLDENKLDNKFMRFLLESKLFSKQYRFLSQGSAQANFGPTHLKQMYFPNAPILEQQKIASILSSVDEALEKTVNIIDCIKKVKQGLMQQLIWNGLNKKEFKDTEIGRIPHDWGIVELRDLGKVITGGTPTTSELDSWKGILPFITPVDISEDKYLVQAERTVNKSVINKNRLFPENSILYTCIGSTIGKIAITQEECTANQQINVIIPHSNVDSDYLYYALLQRTGYIKTLSAQTAVPIINKSLFEKIKIPFPSLNEQKEIAAALNSIDEKISIEKNKIKNLVDIKHGLMQQLLTGKVRVPLNEHEGVPQ